MSTDAIRAEQDDRPTTELVTGVVGDRCANCQAPLASDQRYCVNCGQRRGKARFSYDTMAAQAAPAAPAQAAAPPRQRRPRLSSGATLVAGVATLLIAMGVGVLIGHDSNSTPVRASAPQVITVGGAGAAGTSTGSTAATSSGSAPVKSVKGAKGKAPKTVVVTAKQNKAAASAVGKVLGSGGSFSSNPTQQVGAACSGGAGCQNGKFTGNFFGGG